MFPGLLPIFLHSCEIEIFQLQPQNLNTTTVMGRLTNLTRLTLKGLNLSDPPRNVQKDTRDCIRYLNSKLRCAKGFYRRSSWY